ncbi:MAG: hypothetical protein EOP56_19535 [Sphingobacteriales bacterium]|nr:MAG: hypothetical protein EOP56_19535 [Sphingobacteriales bacterium]
MEKGNDASKISFFIFLILFWSIIYSGIIFDMEATIISINMIQIIFLFVVFFSIYSIIEPLVVPAKQARALITKQNCVFRLKIFGAHLQVWEFDILLEENDVHLEKQHTLSILRDGSIISYYYDGRGRPTLSNLPFRCFVSIPTVFVISFLLFVLEKYKIEIVGILKF